MRAGVYNLCLCVGGWYLAFILIIFAVVVVFAVLCYAGGMVSANK